MENFYQKSSYSAATFVSVSLLGNPDNLLNLIFAEGVDFYLWSTTSVKIRPILWSLFIPPWRILVHKSAGFSSYMQYICIA